MDYEVPSFYYADGVGEIDLLIGDGVTTYAAEVKPPEKNSESLLRMITEILTYTLGYEVDKYEKAIAFFENSPQDKEFLEIGPELGKLIECAQITVFRFEADGKQSYKINKL